MVNKSLEHGILREQVEKWFANEENITRYRNGIMELERSGVFPLLQRIGIPAFLNNGANESMMAAQGNWSNGYQSCLEHIRFFIQLFEQTKPVPMTPPDFGGDALAIARGDLTEEDLKKVN